MNTTTLPSIQTQVEDQLTKAGITDKVIAELEAKADQHDRKIESPEQLREVDEARKEIKAVRLVGEKNAESIHEQYKKLWQTSKDAVNSILPRLKKPEDRLKARIFEYNYEQEQIAKKREEERVAALQERQNHCLAMGFALVNGVWVQSGTGIDGEEVLKADDQKWQLLKKQMELVHQEAEDRRQAEAEAAKEVERKAKELEAREAAVREQERLVKEREEAAERERRTLAENRIVALKEAGWDDDGDSLALYLDGDGPVPSVVAPKDLLHEFESVQISDMVKDGQAELARRKEAEAERIRQQERERIEREQKEQAEKDRVEMEERVARHGDLEYIRQLQVIIKNAGSKVAEMIPKAKSESVRDVLNIVRTDLLEIYGVLTKVEGK